MNIGEINSKVYRNRHYIFPLLLLVISSYFSSIPVTFEVIFFKVFLLGKKLFFSCIVL